MLDAVFTFRGRLNRAQFILRGLTLGIASVALAVALGVNVFGSSDGGGAKAALGPSVLIAAPVAMVIAWIGLSSQVRRLRDMGWSPVPVMLAWIAVLGVDRIIAQGDQPLSLITLFHPTLVGELSNMAMAGCLNAWPSAAFESDPDPELRPEPDDVWRGLNPPDEPRRSAAAPAISIKDAPRPGAAFGRRGL